MNYRAAIFQERLFTLRIRYIKSDKLSQTNCDELLDNFVMKKSLGEMTKYFSLPLVVISLRVSF